MGTYSRWLARQLLTVTLLAGLGLAALLETLSGAGGGLLDRLARLPQHLGLLLPLALAIGLLATLGTASARGEIRACWAAGCKPWRLLRESLGVLALLVLLAACNQAWWAPAALARAAEAGAHRIRGTAASWVGAGGERWDFASWDQTTGRGTGCRVLLLEPQGEGRLIGWWTARRARHGAGGWTLEEGEYVEPGPEGPTRTAFSRRQGSGGPVTPPTDFRSGPRPLETWTVDEFRRQLARPDLDRRLRRRPILHLALRLGLSLAPLLLGLLLLPLALSPWALSPRGLGLAALACWAIYLVSLVGWGALATWIT